jgi:hypothetical protein
MTNATAEQKAQFEKLVTTMAKMKNLPEWKAALWLTSIGSTPASMF